MEERIFWEEPEDPVSAWLAASATTEFPTSPRLGSRGGRFWPAVAEGWVGDSRGRRSRGISNPPAHPIIGWGPSLGQGSVGGLAVVEINETERDHWQADGVAKRRLDLNDNILSWGVDSPVLACSCRDQDHRRAPRGILAKMTKWQGAG